MQTLTEIAGDKSSVIVFPMPIDLVEGMRAVVSTIGEAENQ
jgi:hypothetical protein